MSTASYRTTFSGSAAANYQRFFVPAIATPVSTELIGAADLRPGERVVDVACGTGLIARLAAERVGPSGSVTGVDVSPQMIDVARTVDAPGIDWRVADAATLPLGDASCDVATCQMGLMFMEDRFAAVSEMRRVLVPGGRVVVNTPGVIQPVFASMEQALVDHISPDLGGFVGAVFSMHEPAAVASLLHDAGLEDVAVTETSATLRLPPPAEFLWQYLSLTPLGQFVDQAPAAARAAMEQQVVSQWQPFVADGLTMVEQPMLVATAHR